MIRFPDFKRKVTLKVLGEWQAMLRESEAIKMEEFNIIYIPVPKVACSSVTAMCVDILDFALPDKAWKPAVFRSKTMDGFIDVEKRDKSHITAFDALKAQGYWRFAITRNPYERLVSCYSEKVCNKSNHPGFEKGLATSFIQFKGMYGFMPFDEFVDIIAEIPDCYSDPHFRSQHTFITGRNGDIYVDALYEMKALPALAKEIEKRTAKDIRLPHLLKTGSNEYESYYNKNTKEKVADRYRKDFKLLGYNW